MELITTTITAYDANCIGCKRHSKPVMLSFMFEGDQEDKVHDLFLTQEQAESLHQKLGEAIQRNKETCA